MTIPNEQWRTIDFAPDYQVSDFGRVRRASPGKGATSGRILKNHIDAYGYPALHVSHEKVWFRAKVHILVCNAFHGPKPTAKHEVAHWDGCRTNSKASNLRWATRAENMTDALRHGTHVAHRGSTNSNSKLTESDVADIRARPRKRGLLYELAKQYGVSRNVVGNIRSNPNYWPHVPFGGQLQSPSRSALSKT